jgi:DNA-binding CsgD family transcriptional regulator
MQEAAMSDLAHARCGLRAAEATTTREAPAISSEPPIVQVFRMSGPSDVVRYPRSASSCRPQRLVCLTVSESEVLADAALGLTVGESARVRGKGRETVKTQRASILLRLGARNMAHAVSLLVADRDRAFLLGD